MLSRRNALKTAVAWLLAPVLAKPVARAMKGAAIICYSDIALTGNWQHVCDIRNSAGLCTLWVDGKLQAVTERKKA